MNRRAAFYVVIVFVLGVALGGVGAYLANEWRVFNWHRSGPEYRQGVVKWLNGELALTAAQQAQLQAILEQTGKQYEQLHDRMRAEREQVRQAARQRIRQILSAEQQPKFEELLRQIDAERRQRDERRYGHAAPKETR